MWLSSLVLVEFASYLEQDHSDGIHWDYTISAEISRYSSGSTPPAAVAVQPVSSALPASSSVAPAPPPAPNSAEAALEEKRRRLEAWKAKKAAEGSLPTATTATTSSAPPPPSSSKAGSWAACTDPAPSLPSRAAPPPHTSTPSQPVAGAVSSAAAQPAACWVPWEGAAEGLTHGSQAPALGGKPGTDPAAGLGGGLGVGGRIGLDGYVVPDAVAARKAKADEEEAALQAQKRVEMEARMTWAMGGMSSFPPAAAQPFLPQQLQPSMMAAPAEAAEEESDPLDAFMAAEILPEVKARQEAEKAAKEAERVKQAERLAAGKDLKLPTFNSSDSEEEPEPDAKIEIPFNKMKYVVGPGGVKIQEIQRKSKARVQIIKEEAEMTKAWGSGPTPTFKQQNLEYAAAVRLRQAAEKAARDKAKLLLKAAPGADGQGGVKAIMAKGAAEAAAAGADGKAKAKAGEAAAGKGKEGKAKASGGQGVDTGKEGGEGMEGEERGSSSGDEDPLPGMPVRKMVTLLLYGNQHAVEAAERMIMEAIDNREQKQKQRARDYEKKREEKARLRQMYHMRHSRDYEILELPMGASKAEVKKAYRKLAMKWHPDKHSEEDQEMAKAKFQEIQKAYDRLLSSAEDEKVEAIAC
ncbi:hypothetical protein QJQ45_020286 [Haematococcus lacustris]|nr:hypothetical protein QJQ45_020286 [Haematococcus lacustris]